MKSLSETELERLADVLLENDVECVGCAMDHIGLNPTNYDLDEVIDGLISMGLGICDCCGCWCLLDEDDDSDESSDDDECESYLWN